MPLNEDLPGGSRGLPRVKNCRGSNDWLSIMEVRGQGRNSRIAGITMKRFQYGAMEDEMYLSVGWQLQTISDFANDFHDLEWPIKVLC